MACIGAGLSPDESAANTGEKTTESATSETITVDLILMTTLLVAPGSPLLERWSPVPKKIRDSRRVLSIRR
jgi:hypothetical protein